MGLLYDHTGIIMGSSYNDPSMLKDVIMIWIKLGLNLDYSWVGNNHNQIIVDEITEGH